MTHSSESDFGSPRPPVVGQVVHLRPQIAQPGGRYKVVAVTQDSVKLRQGTKDPIRLSMLEFLERLVTATDFGEGQGVLGAIGYRVGRDAGTEAQRRTLLSRVVSIPLAQLPGVENVQHWGQADTPRRIQKVVACLESFARNERKKDEPNERAVEHWLADLRWFEAKYVTPAVLQAWAVHPLAGWDP